MTALTYAAELYVEICALVLMVFGACFVYLIAMERRDHKRWKNARGPGAGPARSLDSPPGAPSTSGRVRVWRDPYDLWDHGQ